jgi:single-strand DNA-binding protein
VVTLLGNLGRDPALPQTTQGRAVAMSPLAPHDLWRDEHGERQQHTQWHNIVVWGKQAERCEQYLAKGRHVYIEGALRSRFYDDNVGEKRSMVEIVARQVQFLGGGMGKLEAGEGEEGEIWETEPGERKIVEKEGSSQCRPF